MQENRAQQRMQVGYEVFIETASGMLASTCRDISPLGIGLFTKEKIDIGSSISMNLVLSESSLTIDLKGTVRHCTENPTGSAEQGSSYLVGIEFDRETKENFSFLDFDGKIMSRETSHVVTIDAPALRCYQLVADFGRYPEWVKIFNGHKVLDSYPDGRPRLVEWEANVYLRTVHFSQEYLYDDPNLTMSWQGTGGDLLENKGMWKFRAKGNDQCFANLEIKVATDIPAPSRLMRYFSNRLMRRTMTDFGKFVKNIE